MANQKHRASGAFGFYGILTITFINVRMQDKKKQTTFSDRVLRIALSIPEGRVTTYGRIARAAGGGAFSSQSITSILSKAERASKVHAHRIPFHRIVYADGRIWINPQHYKERIKLYKKEGIEIDKDNKVKNFQDILFEFE